MATKRKTPPKNVKELLAASCIPALQAVFDTCEIDAHYGRFAKETILHMIGVPQEPVGFHTPGSAQSCHQGDCPMALPLRVTDRRLGERIL